MDNNGVRILTIDEMMNKWSYFLFFHNKQTAFVNWMRYPLSSSSINENQLVYKNYKKGLKFQKVFMRNLGILDKDDQRNINYFSVRPVMPLSYIPDEVLNNIYYDRDPEVIIIKYGLFPQERSSCSSATFTGSSIVLKDIQYNVLCSLSDPNEKIISMKSAYQESWFKLEPVEWYIDEENEIAISKNPLMSNIPIELNAHTFEETTLYKWLNAEFLDILLKFEKNRSFDVTNSITKNEEIVAPKEETIISENDFDSMLSSATKQMEEILGKSYTKKLNR